MRHEINRERLFEIYSEEYDFHFCRLDEADVVIDFIDKYWKKNHILVLSRSLFDWQYLDLGRQRYNFSLAKSRKDNEIHALMGFIPIGQFDPALQQYAFYGSIWKEREDVAAVGLGTLVAYFAYRELQPYYWGSIGISEVGCRNHETAIGEMEHYFLLNPICEKFNIAKNVEKYCNHNLKNQEDWSCSPLSLQDYTSLPIDSALFYQIYGMKTKDYYIGRYYLHPVYNYQFLAIKNFEEIKAIVVYRKCVANSSACLRIVDFIGDFNALEKVSGSFVSLLVEEKCEYIDFLIGNAASASIEKAGFINKKSTENAIIPNWFEPFEQKNKSLNYSFWCYDPAYNPIFFKGDSDQDRPNLPWW
jgi:hypothetical protein